MEYKSGLIKSPWGRKFMWQLEKNVIVPLLLVYF